jgi:hypothetical protein
VLRSYRFYLSPYAAYCNSLCGGGEFGAFPGIHTADSFEPGREVLVALENPWLGWFERSDPCKAPVLVGRVQGWAASVSSCVLGRPLSRRVHSPC